MTLTPAQTALWANDVTRACLLEAGDDVDSGLAAAEYILSTQPIPEPPIDESPPDRIKRIAEEILQEASFDML